MPDGMRVLPLITVFFQLAAKGKMQIAKHHVVSHMHARDRAEKHKSCSFARLPHELW
jgi:hypothetical protein